MLYNSKPQNICAYCFSAIKTLCDLASNPITYLNVIMDPDKEQNNRMTEWLNKYDMYTWHIILQII